MPVALSSEDSFTKPLTVREKISRVVSSPSTISEASFCRIIIKFASLILEAVRWMHLTALDFTSKALSSKCAIKAEQIFFSKDSSSYSELLTISLQRSSAPVWRTSES